MWLKDVKSNYKNHPFCIGRFFRVDPGLTIVRSIVRMHQDGKTWTPQQGELLRQGAGFLLQLNAEKNICQMRALKKHVETITGQYLESHSRFFAGTEIQHVIHHVKNVFPCWKRMF